MYRDDVSLYVGLEVYYNVINEFDIINCQV